MASPDAENSKSHEPATPTAASVVDATARFECARLGHEPTLKVTSVAAIESVICPCARCGRLIEFPISEVKRVG